MEKLMVDLRMLGVREGDVLMLHTSMKGLRSPVAPDEVITALERLLTPGGTLMVPAFSFRDVTPAHPAFRVKETPSCVGVLPERFRREHARYRSLHPTHSVSAWGKLAYAVTAFHSLDFTPAGPHSPLMQLPRLSGKILMLGCSLSANAFLSGAEEFVRVPDLFGRPLSYCMVDQYGKAIEKVYYPRNPDRHAHYERLADLLPPSAYSHGSVLGGKAWLLNAAEVWDCVIPKLRANIGFFE